MVQREGAPILETQRLSKRFGGVQAVNAVSFGLGAGEVRGLIGPNGAGKTCFLNLLSGIYVPSSGSIAYQGRDITNEPARHRSHVGIGRTYQVAQERGLTAAGSSHYDECLASVNIQIYAV